MSHEQKQHESKSWKYFDRLERLESAKCKKCQKVIKCKGLSTSGLLRHLKSVHREVEAELTKKAKRIPCEKPCASSVQPKIAYFPKTERKDEILAKLASIDGFPIDSIVNSEFIRESFLKQGMCLPTSSHQIMKIIRRQYAIAKQIVVSRIADKISRNAKFSVSLDKYTTMRNRKYLKINLHANKEFWNLGMVRISESDSTDKIFQLIETRLAKFNVCSKKHVISCVTDGEDAMIKLRKSSKVEHQLCFAHGLHSAVCDVLYKRKYSGSMVKNECEKKQSSDEDPMEDDDFSTAMEVSTVDTSDVLRDIVLIDSYEGSMSIVNTIKKVRKIVKIVCKSKEWNETLKNYTKQEHNAEILLKLDTKVRWDMLLNMLETFVLLRTFVSKTLTNLGKPIDLSDEEYQVINVITASLKLVKIGIERLSRQDATLLSAEGVFTFILNELSEQNTTFSIRLKEAILKKLKEYRNENLFGLLHFLHNPWINLASSNSYFSLPTKSTLQSVAEKLISKLFKDSESSGQKMSVDLTEIEIESDCLFTGSLSEKQLSLDEKLDAAIERVTGQGEVSHDNYVCNVATEMDVFLSTGKRTLHLNLLFDALLTIPPTSIEAERAFFVTDLFVPKICTSLSDQNLNILCFLKSYYKSTKNKT